MLPRIIDIILKIALLLVAMFFGKIALAGWGEKLDFITRIGVTVILGLICFTVGILLPFDFFPQIAFISHAINAFIVAVFLFIILFLLSEKRRKPQFLTKRDIESLKKEIDFIKSEITRINQALIKKGIQAKPVSEEKVRKIAKDILKNKNIKNYSILSIKQKDNFWNVFTNIAGKKHKLVIDLYGQLKKFEKIGFDFSRITKRLYEDKLFLLGSVLAIIFFVIVISLATPQNIQRVSETFSLYGVDLVTTDCITPSILLKTWNENENRIYDYDYDFSKAEEGVIEYFEDEIYVFEFFPDNQIIIESEDEIYGAFLITKEEIETTPDLISAIRGESKICSVELEAYEVCSCTDVTDPRTSVHLIEALEELI